MFPKSFKNISTMLIPQENCRKRRYLDRLFAHHLHLGKVVHQQGGSPPVVEVQQDGEVGHGMVQSLARHSQ